MASPMVDSLRPSKTPRLGQDHTSRTPSKDRLRCIYCNSDCTSAESSRCVECDDVSCNDCDRLTKCAQDDCDRVYCDGCLPDLTLTCACCGGASYCDANGCALKSMKTCSECNTEQYCESCVAEAMKCKQCEHWVCNDNECREDYETCDVCKNSYCKKCRDEECASVYQLPKDISYQRQQVCINCVTVL